MMGIFEELKNEVRRREPLEFERWKTYGFELDDTFVSMGPNLGDIIDSLCEEDEDDEDRIELGDVDMMELDEKMQACVIQAGEEGNEDIHRFVADCQEMGFEVEYYRGRNFYYGPAVRLDLQTVAQITNVQLKQDQMGMGYITYLKLGLKRDINTQGKFE